MSDNEINKAIAEHLGWHSFERSGILLPDPPWNAYPPNKPIIGKRIRIPDYANDLNAMHEAEERLTREQCYIYNEMLAEILGKWEPSRCSANWPFHATAHQRAEAFLKTI